MVLAARRASGYRRPVRAPLDDFRSLLQSWSMHREPGAGDFVNLVARSEISGVQVHALMNDRVVFDQADIGTGYVGVAAFQVPLKRCSLTFDSESVEDDDSLAQPVWDRSEVRLDGSLALMDVAGSVEHRGFGII